MEKYYITFTHIVKGIFILIFYENKYETLEMFKHFNSEVQNQFIKKKR